jgi:hypothetical protein
MLKRNTEYQRGIRPTDQHVKYFWQVLEEMSQKERQMFLRFVSGQSRLWSDEKDFIMKFKLMPAAADNDITLPISHTCFFSLEVRKRNEKRKNGQRSENVRNQLSSVLLFICVLPFLFLQLQKKTSPKKLTSKVNSNFEEKLTFFWHSVRRAHTITMHVMNHFMLQIV